MYSESLCIREEWLSIKATDLACINILEIHEVCQTLAGTIHKTPLLWI